MQLQKQLSLVTFKLGARLRGTKFSKKHSKKSKPNWKIKLHPRERVRVGSLISVNHRIKDHGWSISAFNDTREMTNTPQTTPAPSREVFVSTTVGWGSR